MDICVLGMGYIGLPTALLLANNGHKVVGYDIDREKISSINSGKMPFHEKGFQDLLDNVLNIGSFHAEYEINVSDVFLIAVPTPLDKETSLCDLGSVFNACETVSDSLKRENLVIIESTIPPMTCKRQITHILEQSGLKASRDFYIAHCPERAIPGNTFHEMIYNDRIIGGIDSKSSTMARFVYSSFVKGKFHVTDSTTAEMIKLMENTYRDINIALANEFALIAEEFGINVWDAIQIANKHPRVNILNPGPGVGGHCIAIDPWFLTEETNNGRLINLSRQINNSMPNHVMKLVREMLDGINKPIITLFGVAYKGNVGDTRAAPSKKFIKLAKNAGYTIKIYDPYVSEFDYPISTLKESVDKSNCIVILVDHSCFRNINPKDLCKSMSNLNVIDTRNIIDINKWKECKFAVRLLGKREEHAQ